MMILLTQFADFSHAALLFSTVRKNDPYQLANVDIYSNVLFVMVSTMGNFVVTSSGHGSFTHTGETSRVE